MKLIADSGSTKTEWMLCDDKQLLQKFYTNGFNPNYYKAHEISTIIENEIPKNFDCADVKEVFYYGSGCSGKANCESVSDAISLIFKEARVHVFSDLLAAARALLGDEIGIACILGTGSNSCHYDGKKIIKNLPSLGFMLGDEGSATDIGKRVLKAMMYQDAPDELFLDFEKNYRLNLPSVIDSIYRREKPGIFLSQFSLFAGKHSIHPWMNQLVSEAFDGFIQQQIMRYPDFDKNPVCFTGSVAFHFQSILRNQLKIAGIQIGKILASPGDGLLEFHLQHTDL
jgi:glucosamine kinase